MKNVNRITFFFLLGYLSLILTGCPYQSVVPVSEMGVDIPKNLIGKWIESSQLSSEKNYNYYQLIALDKKKFKLLDITYSTYTESYDTSFYTGHFSKVNNTLFMNAMKVNLSETSDKIMSIEASESEPAPAYYIYRVRPSGQFIRMEELSEEITEVFEKPAQLSAYIQKHMDNELFYNDKYTNKVFVKLQ